MTCPVWVVKSLYWLMMDQNEGLRLKQIKRADKAFQDEYFSLEQVIL